jgi:hypothetical protein
MNGKLKLCVTAHDYQVHAGDGWPTYTEYLNGINASSQVVQREIDEFTKKHLEDGVWFPIRNSSACQSKWTWSTIYLNQLASASCHRVYPETFTLDNFDEFHNLPGKLEDRKLMLDGRWPGRGCEYCRDIERAGGFSDRQHNLEIRGLTPPELEKDHAVVNVTPRIVEIFAQNTCNLACVYCNGNLSSRIEHENKKFGPFLNHGVSIPVITTPTVAADEYFAKFLDWADRNVQTLRRLHLLGGETFLQDRLMVEILDILDRRPSPELTLCIFSNFNAPDSLWYSYLDRIKTLQKRGHIKMFDLTASIDCWGPAAEYARSGLNLKEFEKKFAWAATQHGDWLTLLVNQTITPLTIRTMPELIEKINYYSEGKHISHFWEMYIGDRQYLHPRIFSYTQWEQDFDRILLAMPNTNTHQEEAVIRMKGIQSYLKQYSTNNLEEIAKLHIYLDELDFRRGTNWREIFPYLEV